MIYSEGIECGKVPTFSDKEGIKLTKSIFEVKKIGRVLIPDIIKMIFSLYFYSKYRFRFHIKLGLQVAWELRNRWELRVQIGILPFNLWFSCKCLKFCSFISTMSWFGKTFQLTMFKLFWNSLSRVSLDISVVEKFSKCWENKSIFSSI